MDDEIYYLLLLISILFLWILFFIIICPLWILYSLMDFIIDIFNKIFKMITGCF